jgi:hypothetical protein
MIPLGIPLQIKLHTQWLRVKGPDSRHDAVDLKLSDEHDEAGSHCTLSELQKAREDGLLGSPGRARRKSRRIRKPWKS